MTENVEMKTINDVQEYYGKVLKTNEDLKTTACCVLEAMPKRIREALKDIHPEVLEKFYGCGSPIPYALEGKTVLDLGSGTGRDCFILSKLVGENGKVIGIDMTDEQIDVANNYIDYHTDKFNFKKSNIEFKKGYIEDLKSLGIEDNSIDLVVSNCVLNLSSNKEEVFSEIFRVLKPGGELYFSDVFANRRISKELAEDPVLLGECLGGAFYTEDFRRMMLKMNCADYRVMSSAPIALNDPEVERKLGMINFDSVTVRAFKLDLEDRCENFGQVAYYLGTIDECPHSFVLDDHHTFKTHEPMPVCGNTADMLSKTRLSEHFKIVGDKTHHLGIFDCAPQSEIQESETGTSLSCC